MKNDTDKIYAEQIANEYSPKETSKVVALRKLDRRAKLPANIFAYTFGIVFTLVFEWLRGGCEKPTEFVSDVVISCIPKKDIRKEDKK